MSEFRVIGVYYSCQIVGTMLRGLRVLLAGLFHRRTRRTHVSRHHPRFRLIVHLNCYTTDGEHSFSLHKSVICILVFRFLNNKFSDSYTPTIENFYRKVYRIRGEVYQLDILDTSGNQFVTFTTILYLLIVYSCVVFI